MIRYKSEKLDDTMIGEREVKKHKRKQRRRRERERERQEEREIDSYVDSR